MIIPVDDDVRRLIREARQILIIRIIGVMKQEVICGCFSFYISFLTLIIKLLIN